MTLVNDNGYVRVNLIGGIVLVLSLISSWTYFVNEQNMNSMFREQQKVIIETHRKQIAELEKNQSVIVNQIANAVGDMDVLQKTSSKNQQLLYQIIGRINGTNTK